MSGRAVYPMDYDTYRTAWRAGWGEKWDEKRKKWVKARRKDYDKGR